MKWSGNILVFLAIVLASCGEEKTAEVRSSEDIQIIPQVANIELDSGYFCIDNTISITAFEDSKNEAEYLKALIEESSNFEVTITYPESIDFQSLPSTILLFNQHQTIGNEAYDLDIGEKGIKILAMNNKGIMNGIQTLRQLFVDAFNAGKKRSEWCLPMLHIKDAPRFAHRGLLLDCCRHFFEKDVIKKYIDLLAFYKMNTLHWHLTEDQGWRIAIDKYPKLTEVAAYRKEADGSTYGGFYTKADIKEIVAYAQERHITIIPEIELPGHSQAAIAAYPHLSCTGEQVEVANDWGVFKEIYCAGNDSVFVFLEDVLTEVMELFPSKYIHIGGDEAPKFRWKNCRKCQQRIKSEGLKDEHELQSYFIGRIEKFLNKNGRQLIGWDEILEGGLSENATVQSWRGMDGGLEAAESGHYAIMSPTSHCYLDYDLKAIDLEKVYNFDPIPEDLPEDKQHFILGGEVNMWTERVPDEANLDSKVFPRMMALSEVLWSYPQERDYEGFYNRVQYHYPILEHFGVKYGQETVPMTYEVTKGQYDSTFVELKASSDKIKLEYKWDCDGCDKTPTEYTEKLFISNTGNLKVQPLKDDKPYGEEVIIPFNKHFAIGDSVIYQTNFNQWYTAGGEGALVDSKLGTLDFRDGAWQGFWGEDLVVTIPANSKRLINTVSANFYQYNNSWIFIPTEMIVELSPHGKEWYEYGRVISNIDPKKRGKVIETLEVKGEYTHYGFLRITVKNIGKVPDWHEAAGSDAWLFIDEIIVR